MKYTKEKLFYFDCEWVPLVRDVFDLKLDYPLLAESFDHQVEKWKRNAADKGEPSSDDTQWWWEKRAHFYPEFCKMVCVSYGYYSKGNFIVKSLFGHDEKKILEQIPTLFNKVDSLGYILSGYAIKRFDMPWLSKRLMINGLKPPKNISFYGKKPWEIECLDIPEVWGQGNMQESYTPFELSCAAMGLESSKGDLSGDKVKDAFWNGEIERIKEYCELDVIKSKDLAEKIIDLI